MVVINTSPGRKGLTADYVDEKIQDEAEARTLALNTKLSLSGGTMTGPIVIPSKASSAQGGIQLPANSMIGAGTTAANIIGRENSDTIVIGNTTMATKMAGKGARPTYNDKNIALAEDIPDISGKQDKIKAGTNVSIGSDGVTISAVDTIYSPATASADGLMTSTQFTKLKGIADGAEVNVIEAIKLGSTALTPSGTTVTIPLATSVGTAANPITAKAVNDALKNKLDTTGTAAKATADASGNTITTTYATKTEVNAKQDKLTAGSNITLSGNIISASIDLSAYAKKADLPPAFGLIPVDSLPTSGIRTDAIYLLKTATTATNNARDEYIYVSNAWEKIGTTQADLSGYLPLTGGTVTGQLLVDGLSSFNAGLTTKGLLCQMDAGSAADGIAAFFMSNESDRAYVAFSAKSGEYGLLGIKDGKPSFKDSASIDHELAYKTDIPSGVDLSGYLTKTEASSTYATASSLGAYLPLSGGTMTGELRVNGGDKQGGSKLVLVTGSGQITNSGTQTLFGFGSTTQLLLGHSSYSLAIRGSATRPTYNGSDMALKSDVDAKQNTLTAGSNITINGNTISATNTTYGNATTSAAGLMSVDDKKKLNGVATGAQVNVIESVKVNGTALAVSSKSVNIDISGKQDKLTAGSNISISGNTISATNTTYGNATTSAAGLMSATDKQKLDGIETGANWIQVDSSLSSTSTNPLQNKAIKSALDGKLSTSGGGLTGDLYWNNASAWCLPYLLAFKNADTGTAVTYPYTGFYQWGNEWQVNARDASNNWAKNVMAINLVSGVAQFYATPQVNGTNVALTSDLPRITISTSEPSGGQDGDLWFQYEE